MGKEVRTKQTVVGDVPDLNLNLNSLLVKRQIDNPSPGMNNDLIFFGRNVPEHLTVQLYL